MTAEDVIQSLKLEPHPEGGHFRETWRASARVGERGYGTAIYYLLGAGERSRWHRIDATELWHYYAGAALRLSTRRAERVDTHTLGPDVGSGERPQHVIEPHVWQSAETTGAWTLVGCTVCPAFEFSGFELDPGD